MLTRFQGGAGHICAQNVFKAQRKTQESPKALMVNNDQCCLRPDRLCGPVGNQHKRGFVMGAKRVMRLVDERTGRMECQVCGSVHHANIMPESGGRFHPGSW